MKQACKDVAHHILTLLLVVEDSARHPQHLGIMLLEQLLNRLTFHHVFYNNTPQKQKMLTSIQFFILMLFLGYSSEDR